MKKHTLLLALILLFIGSTSERLAAQWKMIAANVVSAVGAGAIHYKDGVLWAGTQELVYSLDSGKTWTRNSLSKKALLISSIDFVDRNIGIVSNWGKSPVFLTTDGGSTWKDIKNSTGTLCQSIFDNYSNLIHAVGLDGVINTSTDAGTTWNKSTGFFQFSTCLTYYRNTLYVFGDDPISGNGLGYVLSSTDNGKNWIRKPGRISSDSWSIAIDSCDPNILYVVNEHELINGESFSNIFVSINGGDSWSNPLKKSGQALSGALATSQNTINVISSRGSNGGMYRSKDKGITWKNFPAPDCIIDTRSIVALNDNLLFLLDDNGNIWMTDNGGGDMFI